MLWANRVFVWAETTGACHYGCGALVPVQQRLGACAADRMGDHMRKDYFCRLVLAMCLVGVVLPTAALAIAVSGDRGTAEAWFQQGPPQQVSHHLTADAAGLDPVSDLNVVAGTSPGSAVVTWSTATTGGASVRVVRLSSGSAAKGPNDGTAIYNGSLPSCTDSGLSGGITYTYTVFARDNASPTVNWSAGSSRSYAMLASAAYLSVYRFRNLKNGYYLLSADPLERANINRTLMATWLEEGVAYTVNPTTNTAPQWRFRNLRGGFYLYSADPNEKANIIATLSGTWAYEGQIYSVSMTPAGTSPVWRFLNKKNGTYLYSADPNEKNTIVATLSSTWKLEGPAYYLAP